MLPAMSSIATMELTTDPSAVRAIGDAIVRAGLFAIDLEFVSESRYVPDLALVQVAWGDPAAPELAAIDPLAVDPAPIFEAVKSPDVAVIAHAAKQDLALLAARHQLRATALVDTQIAAMFAGFGEQVGYGKLVSRLLRVDLDKGPQFTDWSRRPLSAAQLRYAIDDVRYLLAVWPILAKQLVELGRRDWAREESDRLAATAGDRSPPDEIYKGLGGRAGLAPAALGSLRALAAWREREALATNTPPSWIVPDAAMVDLCRRAPSDAQALRRTRGVGSGTVRRYGAAIVDAIQRGAMDPPPPEPRPGPALGPREQAWAAMIGSLIAARAAQHNLPPRLVAARGDAEELVASAEQGGDPGSVSLLSGWRRKFVGDEALAWLRGEIAIAIDRSAPGGLAVHPFTRRT